MNVIKDEDWYSMELKDVNDKDKEKDDKNDKERNEVNEKNIKQVIEKMKELEAKVFSLERNVKNMESLVHTLTNENLKMTNRVLEAEIALERAKNSLVRNHIPFPFASSPISNRFRL